MINWTDFAINLLAVRDANAVSITLRRGSATVAAQTMRIERRSAAAASNTQRSDGASEVSTSVVILGAADLDIAPQDRFTFAGQLYEVKAVRPNRRAAAMAEADLIE